MVKRLVLAKASPPDTDSKSGFLAAGDNSRAVTTASIWRALWDLPAAVTNDRMCPIFGSESSTYRDDQRGLLRFRLRMAAFVLFCTLSVFLLRDGYLAVSQGLLLTHAPHFAFFLLAIGTLWLAVVFLCERHAPTMTQLRWWEIAVFGAPSAFLLYVSSENLAVDWSTLTERECQLLFRSYAAETVVPWILLIFAYALFIPSGWKRTVAFTGTMAVMPFVSLGMAGITCDRAQHAFDPLILSNLVLWMATPLAVAVYGSHRLHLLRKEAWTARQLGSYRLKKLLGAGGMGEVYLAEHYLLKRPCAVKLIKPSKANDPKALARFEAEVQAMANLTHWNSIEVFDFGHTQDGTFYFAMEYLPGLNLQQLVDEYGPLSSGRTIHLMRQVCRALAEAHQQGMIHRDVKPGNIFAAYRGGVHDVAKLLDFGLAKSIAGDAPAIKLTHDGIVLGSPLFTAPENVMREREPDHRSDIYSLGAVMYFLLTGRAVFPGDNAIKVLFAHVNEAVAPPRQWNPEIPADLERVMLRCLAKAPEDRFQDVMSLERALAACSAAGEWSDADAAHWWSQLVDAPEDVGRPAPVEETTAFPVPV